MVPGEHPGDALSHSLLEMIFEALPDPVLVVRAEDRVILRCSPRVEEVFGYAPEELVGRSTRVLHVDDEHYRRFDELGAGPLLRGEVARLEFEMRRKDGTVFPTAHAVAVLRDEAGAWQMAVSIVQDISSRRAAEERLRGAERLESVGRLAGGIAHDFNNLLLVVMSNAELALEDGGLPGMVRESLEQILRAGGRGADLTRQLLAFSRKQVMERRTFDLRDSAREVESMMGRLLGERITLTLDLDAAPVPVHADPGQLQQVLVNLLLNARDAMPEGGVIRVRLRGESAGSEGRAVLEVEDEGVGMDTETLERIFDPFFTTKEVGAGTGLGLSTVYGVVAQTGGEVTVRSEPGRGSCFRIDLPLAEEVAEAAGAPATGGAGDGLRILVVEDEPEVRRLVVRLLERGGLEATAAESPEEALAHLEAAPRAFDLLLTDVLMPRMTGPELAARAEVVAPGLPVLFTSGYPESPDLRAANLPEGAPLLSKPFRRQELLDRVHELARRRG